MKAPDKEQVGMQMTEKEDVKMMESNNTGMSPGELHRQLMDQYGRYVYTIIYNKLRSCGTKEDIEECFSDVFADMFTAADREGAAAAGKLAGTIAKRRAIDYYRRLSARNSRSADISSEELEGIRSGVSVEEISETNDLRRIILGLIDSLGEPDSTIIIQKYYYDRKSADIAETLSMSAAAVRLRSSRALKKLKSLLAEKGIAG